ncbi:hypothetical protein YC2023_100331 [Brassica napus]
MLRLAAGGRGRKWTGTENGKEASSAYTGILNVIEYMGSSIAIALYNQVNVLAYAHISLHSKPSLDGFISFDALCHVAVRCQPLSIEMFFSWERCVSKINNVFAINLDQLKVNNIKLWFIVTVEDNKKTTTIS